MPVLFTIFGFGVTKKLLVRVILGVGGIAALAAGIYFGFSYVMGLRDRAVSAETKLGTATNLNIENAKAGNLKEKIDQGNRDISAEERAAARARAQTYKEIQDAIQASKPSDTPVSPVIANTLDRLWAEGSTSDKGQDGIR